MLLINGKQYAKNDKEFISTLFQQGGTAAGFYKVLKGGVQLFDMQHNLFAFIVNNKHGEQFFVDAITTANGKPRYMYSTSCTTEKMLGLDKMSYSGEKDLIKFIFNQLTKRA